MTLEQAYIQLRNENEELKGYKRVIDNLKSEGFDSVMSIKDYITKTKDKIVKLEEDNSKLKDRLQKMKCCGNCKFFWTNFSDFETACQKNILATPNKNCDKWEENI